MPPPRTIEDLRTIQESFFSFMTVRHPFERILSAYRDKFFILSDSSNERNKAAKFHKMYGKHIIKTYRRPNDTLAQETRLTTLLVI